MSNLKMPAAEEATLARRAEIVAALKRIAPGDGVVDDKIGMGTYETDGLTALTAVAP